jgi:hypothetical protein
LKGRTCANGRSHRSKYTRKRQRLPRYPRTLS